MNAAELLGVLATIGDDRGEEFELVARLLRQADVRGIAVPEGLAYRLIDRARSRLDGEPLADIYVELQKVVLRPVVDPRD
jgi:hypothetical protein